MLKPKVALVKDGFLPPGSENVRGRLSLDAINRCKELAKSGIAIEGYSVSEDTNTVEKVTIDPNRIVDIPDESRAEELWTAHTSEGPVGMRTVCNNCRASLTYCRCEHPRVWLDHTREAVVYFKPRPQTTVFKKGW